MTDSAPSADRSLADRVDAIERALTDDDPTPNGSTALPTRQTTERVDALEADLEALRASVEALRGVVGALDRDTATPPRGTPPGAVPTDDAPPVDEELGALFAPTGRVIPSPTRAEAGVTVGDTDDTDDTDVGDAPAGLLARVTETL